MSAGAAPLQFFMLQQAQCAVLGLRSSHHQGNQIRSATQQKTHTDGQHGSHPAVTSIARLALAPALHQQEACFVRSMQHSIAPRPAHSKSQHPLRPIHTAQP